MISSGNTVILTQAEYDEMYDESCNAYMAVIKKDQEVRKMKQQAIALIKDGRFVEALRVLEDV